MKADTVKTIFENEVDGYAEITVLGVVICSHCFSDWVDANDEDIKQLSEEYHIINSNDLLGHPYGATIIGKPVNDLDNNKSIKQLKDEMVDDLLKYGILSDEITIVSKGPVEFISGVMLFDESDEGDESEDE
jgi:hypothetical protein